MFRRLADVVNGFQFDIQRRHSASDCWLLAQNTLCLRLDSNLDHHESLRLEGKEVTRNDLTEIIIMK